MRPNASTLLTCTSKLMPLVQLLTPTSGFGTQAAARGGVAHLSRPGRRLPTRARSSCRTFPSMRPVMLPQCPLPALCSSAQCPSAESPAPRRGLPRVRERVNPRPTESIKNKTKKKKKYEINKDEGGCRCRGPGAPMDAGKKQQKKEKQRDRKREHCFEQQTGASEERRTSVEVYMFSP